MVEGNLNIAQKPPFDYAHCDSQTERSRSMFVLIFLILIATFSLHTSAQKTDAFARVNISPREGVVRQPYKLTITVYSSTWFAKPLKFANLQINNAFIIPFTRTVSSMNYINKKKYATLSFYYLVFPYNTGTLEIPELEISTSIPPEGESKGEPIIIKTRRQKIEVNPLPSSKNEKVWMVAKNVSVSESWDKPLENIKVGDVAERKITITVEGTLPSFIQPMEIEKPKLASIYPKEPVLQDKRNNEDVNGLRVEKYAYLFENEGDIILPEENILWFNPYTKRVYKRTIPEREIIVAANPDLDLMISLKDSLQAMATPINTAIPDEKPIPWIWIIVILISLFIVYIIVKFIISFSKKIKTKQAVYRQSEAFYFKKLIKTLNHKTTDLFIRDLYVWFDKARNPKQSPAIINYLLPDEKTLFKEIVWTNYAKENSNFSTKEIRELTTILKNARARIINQVNKNLNSQKLNPI